jgi:uncharacterized membrane protein (GlpM family)
MQILECPTTLPLLLNFALVVQYIVQKQPIKEETTMSWRFGLQATITQ